MKIIESSFTIVTPFKFKYFKTLKNKELKLLDVGAGNHSASFVNKWFPAWEYYGIDISRDYDNNENDFKLMHAFYEMDLTRLEFSAIPDAYFDVIMMAHVIEHLYNGDKVIEGLLKKLKVGGHIYIEYPGFKSTKLPKMKGTLNFFDDITHCRIYSLLELYNLLMLNKVKIIKGGIRRNFVNIVFSPLYILRGLIRDGFISGCYFWDLLGFSEFVIGRKK